METKKAIEFLRRYGDLELSDDEVDGIIDLLEQGESCKKFLDSLKWTTIYEGGRIFLETRVVYWDVEEKINCYSNIDKKI